MSDPRRPEGYDPNRPQWSQPTEQLGSQYPPVDPAYGSPYSYPGYVPSGPPPGPEPTQQLPPYWTQTQYQPPPPPPSEPPPGPPKSPRWLWVLAGVAVMLVVGLVIALVIANGSARDETAVAPLPPMPETSTTAPLPTTTRTTAPTPTTTTSPQTSAPTATSPGSPTTTADAAATETVVYNVTGEGRAISITYVDTGGMLQMEFNVVLPWSRQVALSPSTAKAASVTVINVGREIGCSITLNGAPMQQRSGTGLTICSSVGN
jgi:hypothetical protein